MVAVRAPARVNPFLAAKRRPLVVGHRGVPVACQENTLAGFRRAIALGVDAIELDVRVTRDGRAVVFHDSSLYRLTGVRRSISDLAWDEISALRIPALVDAGGGLVRYEAAQPIPLLAEVLDEIAGRVAINIELKPRWLGDDIAAIVAATIAEAGAGPTVMVTSYDPRKLRDIGRIDRSLVLGYSWSAPILGLRGRRILDRLVDPGWFGVHAVAADHDLVDGSTVHRLRSAGVAIGAHVLFAMASRPHGKAQVAEVERLIELGVDWIESDDPERLQRMIG